MCGEGRGEACHQAVVAGNGPQRKALTHLHGDFGHGHHMNLGAIDVRRQQVVQGLPLVAIKDLALHR